MLKIVIGPVVPCGSSIHLLYYTTKKKLDRRDFGGVPSRLGIGAVIFPIGRDPFDDVGVTVPAVLEANEVSLSLRLARHF